MRIDIQMDENKNFIIEKGTFLLTNSIVDYVRQKVRTKIKWFLNEWFMDISLGIPYFQYIYVKNPDIQTIESILRLEIENIKEVKEVPKISIDYAPDTRRKMFINIGIRCFNEEELELEEEI